jgi:hypothetical protein
VNEILSKYYSPEVASDFAKVSLQDVRPPRLWGAMLAIIAGWIVLATAASAVLYHITGNNLSFGPIIAAMAITPNLIKTIFRFLFWGPADYALEALKIVRGRPYFHQEPQA